MASERGPNNYEILKIEAANAVDAPEVVSAPAQARQEERVDWDAIGDYLTEQSEAKLAAMRATGHYKPVEVLHTAGRLDNEDLAVLKFIEKGVGRQPDEKYADPLAQRAVEVMEAVRARQQQENERAQNPALEPEPAER